jgi:short-subunit dehydrogenase
MLDTNVTAVVRMSSALIPELEKQGGGLMVVSSMAGIHPVPYQTAYSATKAFLVHYGAGLWHELQGRNVSVTTYAPSGVVTEMTAGENFNALRKWLMPVEQAALAVAAAVVRRVQPRWAVARALRVLLVAAPVAAWRAAERQRVARRAATTTTLGLPVTTITWSCWAAGSARISLRARRPTALGSCLPRWERAR